MYFNYISVVLSEMKLTLAFVTLVFIVQVVAASPKMDIPTATEVRQQTIEVDSDKIAEHLAKEKAKLIREQHDKSITEMKRLTDAKITFEKLLVDERIQQERDAHENNEKRIEAEWRKRHPVEARERDRMEQEKQQHELRLTKAKNQEFFRTWGMTLIGTGVGLCLCSFM